MDNVTGTTLTLAGYFTNVTATGTLPNIKIATLGGYMTSSSISGALIYAGGYGQTSYLIQDAFTANSYYQEYGSTLTALSTITAGVVYQGGGSFALNSISPTTSATYTCVGTTASNTQVYGNKMPNGWTAGQCLNSDNSTSAVSSKTFVLIDDGSMAATTTVASNVTASLSADVITSSGVVTSSPVASWTLTNAYNGTTVSDGTYSGNSIQVNLNKPEDYIITISSLASFTNLIGNLNHQIDVTGPVD